MSTQRGADQQSDHQWQPVGRRVQAVDVAGGGAADQNSVPGVARQRADAADRVAGGCAERVAVGQRRTETPDVTARAGRD
jgi:hypothetical protein